MTDKPKVTQADRDAAQALCASGWTHAIEAFARHRIAAEQSRDGVIEECARVADKWTDGVMIQCMSVQAEQQTADDIAQALRAMKGRKP